MASTILARSYTNLKNRKSVARKYVVGGIAQSPHVRAPRGGRTYGHRAEAARSKTARWRRAVTAPSPRSLCTEAATGSVRLPSGGCGDCTATATEIARFSYNLRAALCTDLPRLAPEGPYKKSHDARRKCQHIRRSP